MLDAESPEVKEFLQAWHENGRARFERDCDALVYDDYAQKSAKTRKKYIALDFGRVGLNQSGKFLVDRLTHRVFSIKAYGVPNRDCGTIESLTMRYQEATTKQKETFVAA